ncbi:hypothetical protein D3C71_1507250 [compost metagenome]
MITAPSTIKPKSSAPKLIRLPLTPNVFIMLMAKSRDSGMTEATIKPALRLPRNSTRTSMTMRAPSKRLCSTVPMALFTIFVRSRKGSIRTPLGSVF